MPASKSDLANAAVVKISRVFDSITEYQKIWKTTSLTTKSMQITIRYYEGSIADAKLSMQTIREGAHQDAPMLAYRLSMYETTLNEMRDKLAKHIAGREARNKTLSKKTSPDTVIQIVQPQEAAPDTDESCNKRIQEYSAIEPLQSEKSADTTITVQPLDESDSSVAAEIESVQRPEDIAKQLATEERRRRCRTLTIVLVVLSLIGGIIALSYFFWKRQ